MLLIRSPGRVSLPRGGPPSGTSRAWSARSQMTDVLGSPSAGAPKATSPGHSSDADEGDGPQADEPTGGGRGAAGVPARSGGWPSGQLRTTALVHRLGARLLRRPLDRRRRGGGDSLLARRPGRRRGRDGRRHGGLVPGVRPRGRSGGRTRRAGCRGRRLGGRWRGGHPQYGSPLGPHGNGRDEVAALVLVLLAQRDRGVGGLGGIDHHSTRGEVAPEHAVAKRVVGTEGGAEMPVILRLVAHVLAETEQRSSIVRQ